MDRYLVISPHTEEQCRVVVKSAIAAGFVANVDWGCLDHDHTGWATVEAESHEHALMLVPPLMRREARAVRLAKFGPRVSPDAQ